ncbi:MAG: hypothetical protein CMO44_14780 [Verrucomicrobiales bacterium]|nr:hypothetical protein [Verrucomicrobiales bacterium]|tara:strand:+ start:15462 stop:15659 length:198 start_codon:yes stop_codon:yes gene_type:complete
MENFNTPGSNKSWMDDGFKKFIIERQLENVRNILNGTLEKKLLVNSKGEVSRQIVINYDNSSNLQ